MSTTIKIVLRKKANKDGSYPLAIRITKDRKTSFIHLGHSLEAKDWDAENSRVRKSHHNSGRLNSFLKVKLGETEAKLLDLQTQKNDVSSKTIKRSIKVAKENMFFAQAEIHKANLRKAGKYNRLSPDTSLLNRFKEFIGGDISFQEITISLLTKYQAYLKAEQLAPQTVYNHLNIICKLFNQAIDDNLVDAKYYPFGRNKFSLKQPKTMKIGLTAEDVKAIEQLDLSDAPKLHHARNIWLFSFYFAGMRVSDVFRIKWSDFQGDRLFYTMGKNTKGGSLKVPQKALNILEQYKREDSPHDLVFPELHPVRNLKDSFEVQKEIKSKLTYINASLKTVAERAKIKAKMTMHIARHTFGNISGDKIPIQMLQKLYRHSDIKTTMGYQANFINKDADDALDAVIGT